MTDRVEEDLPCAVVVELITEYLDDALPADQRSRLAAHLAECDGCSTALDQFATTVRLTGRLAVQDVDRLDDATRENLLGAFRAWVEQRPGPTAG